MIYTSNYATAKNHPNALGISRGVPEWFKGERFWPLAPSKETFENRFSKTNFDKLFKAQLEKLDPKRLEIQLQNKILCCYENIQKEWCHRQLVMEWFNSHGIECEEWSKNGLKQFSFLDVEVQN